MGVPALFRWLSQKYPKIISSVVEDHAMEIDGVKVPVDTTKPNPNGEEMDNLYLDMNGIVHPCSHPEDKPAPANEEEMMLEIFNYTDRVVNMVRPRKVLMIAVDGVAPRAKMNQQRSRRFRSAQEAKEKDAEKEEFLKLLKEKNGGQLDEEVHAAIVKKTWDSNSITPGTPFMDILAASLRYWVAFKMNKDPAWANLKVIISDATVPGEGEHKIMEFVRSQRRQQTHDPNTRHVIYGLDADLIMLGLATHEPHFRVLREDVFFDQGKKKNCKMCGQSGHWAEDCKGEAKKKQGEFDEKTTPTLKPFIWLHVSILREYLAIELNVPGQPFKFDLERALDDWVFMCFFVGNDFLPHLPSLDIRDNGIDTLIAIWRDNLPQMGGYVTKDGHVDLKRAQLILSGLAKQEDAIFKRRKQAEDRREAGAKRRKLEQEARNNRNNNNSPMERKPSVKKIGSGKFAENMPKMEDLVFFDPKDLGTQKHMDAGKSQTVDRGAMYEANMANKSAAAALKAQLAGKGEPETPTKTDQPENGEQTPASEEASQTPASALGKRKAELMEGDAASTPGRSTPASTNGTPKSDEPPPDNVRLWEDGYGDRYYEAKFHVDPKDIDFRHQVANAYVEGLCWVLLYYFQGCPSWTWFYPYHYAPFAADFVDIDKLDIKFEKGKPFKPYEQLMGVMPAASAHTLPEVFHPLMKDPESEIIDFYPEDFPVDLNGKKFAWQGVVILPFIEEKRLLDAMAKKYPMLTEAEVTRNEMGQETLIMSTQHPLYEDIASKFYSKTKNADTTMEIDPNSSHGLHGTLEKNESYIPSSALIPPFPDNAEMPELDDDASIQIAYHMPASSHIHKSMLLRGVQFAPPALDQADIETTRSRASRSGRSFGGAPFRGDDRNFRGGRGGRGRGGGGDFNRRGGRGGGGGGGGPGGQRGGFNPDNPFAAHLKPGFVPPPPPHLAAASGWVPPPPDQVGGGGGGRGGGGYGPGQGYGGGGGRDGYGGGRDGYGGGRDGYGGGRDGNGGGRDGYGGGRNDYGRRDGGYGGRDGYGGGGGGGRDRYGGGGGDPYGRRDGYGGGGGGRDGYRGGGGNRGGYQGGGGGGGGGRRDSGRYEGGGRY